MPKFTGFIISRKPSVINDTLRGLWINVTRMDGQPLIDIATGEVYKIAVDVKDLGSNWDDVRGLNQGSLVEFTCETIAEHNLGRDKVIPAKGKYPASPVHQVVGYERASLKVLRAVVPMNLATAADNATEVATPEELQALAAKVNASAAIL
jgi:hypothetical protein